MQKRSKEDCSFLIELWAFENVPGASQFIDRKPNSENSQMTQISSFLIEAWTFEEVPTLHPIVLEAPGA